MAPQTEIIEIESAADPRVAVYASLTDAELSDRRNPGRGVLIA